MEKQTLKVYVLYNAECQEYFDEGGYTNPQLLNAVWWLHKDNADKARMTLDEPEKFVVRKMKVDFEIIE